MEFSKSQKQKIRKIIKNHFGHSDFGKIRKYLKSKSINEYGCFFYKENIGNGVSLSYTSNPNCFASYLIDLKLVGMTNQSAIQYKDITTAGKQRGCGNYYIF